MGARLDVKTLDEARAWVLENPEPKGAAFWLLAWVIGVCFAAGLSAREINDRIAAAQAEQRAKADA